MTVAKDGMIWAANEAPRPHYDTNIPIGTIIEINMIQIFLLEPLLKSKVFRNIPLR
jgi:hypothetical protein